MLITLRQEKADTRARPGRQQTDKIIAAVLKRSGDALFRLGGEEFGVLYTTNSEAKAVYFADIMRSTIQELGILHKASPKGVVTASFGVTYWDTNEEASPDRIYIKTDEALYLSKEAGRNKVSLK